MRNIVWSDDALHDYKDSILHIATDNEQAATLVADRIEKTVSLLAQTPIGRPGRVVGTYEKPALKTPYIIVYALTDQTVTIVHMIH